MVLHALRSQRLLHGDHHAQHNLFDRQKWSARPASRFPLGMSLHGFHVGWPRDMLAALPVQRHDPERRSNVAAA
jgi:hypothetical protein